MKKVYWFFILVNIVAILMCAIAFSEDIKVNTGGQVIYQSKLVADSNSIKGINLDRSEITRIIQFLAISDNAYIVMGVTRSGGCELLLVSLADKRKYVIAAYPSVIAEAKKRITVFKMKKNMDATFLVFEYDEQNGKSYDIFQSSQRYDFKFSKRTKRINKDSRLLISDANNDGYSDILLWESDTKFASESSKTGIMSAMIFNPEKMMFSDAANLKDLKSGIR